MHLFSNLFNRASGKRAKFFAFLLILSMAMPSYAQQQKVTITGSDLTVGQVFQQIEQQTGLSIDFDSQVVDLSKKTTSVSGGTIDSVLRELFPEGSFDISYNGRHVILKKKAPQIAKTSTVKGTVLDKQGIPVVGAGVFEKGNEKNGVVSDLDGHFSINIPTAASLVVSSMGYLSQEIEVNGKNNLNIVLNEDTFTLDDVVVVGYGTVQKSKVTGSVSQVSEKALQGIPVPSFEQAIAGLMPGVQVSQQSGAPGTSASMRIRGASSITAGTNPLIVIDGFPTTSDDLSSINTEDIETIDVLKDASSAAIYGSRGANGVILITTKKGKTGKPQVGLKAYFGFQKVAKKVDLMDAYEFAGLAKVVADNYLWDNYGLGPDTPNDERPKKAKVPAYLIPYLEGQQGLPNTDWQDEIFRNAPIQEYDVSVSGGADKVSYYTSFSYLNQAGIIQNSGFERLSAKAKLNVEINKHISLDIDINPTFTKKDKVSEANHKQDGVILTAMLANPAARAYNEDGTLMFGDNIAIGLANGSAVVESPLALAKCIKDQQKTFGILGNANLNIKIIDNLLFKSHFGVQMSKYDEDYFRPTYLGAYNAAAPQLSKGMYWGGTTLDWVNENTLSYSLEKGDHYLDALLGLSFQKESYSSATMTASDFPTNNITNLIAGIVNEGSTSSSNWSLMSYFARVNYAYKNRYIVSASIRRDGSSRFGKDNRFGTFPSVSLGWRVSEEPWMKSQKAISNLKLRASYGITGNFQISNYGAYALMSTANYVYNGTLANGLTPATSPNPNIGWEKTAQANFGVDFGFFNNRLQVMLDYYNSTTDGILLDVPVPAISGFTTSLQNIGKVGSNGFEVMIKGEVGNKFRWSPSLNFSMNRTKVLALGPDQDQILSGASLTQVGYELGRYYLYNIIGVFKDEEDLASYPHLSTSQVGTYKYEDISGPDGKPDGQINDFDRKPMGSYSPDFTVGFQNSFSFNRFDLNVMLNWVQGFEIFNQAGSFLLNEQAWSTPTRRLIGNYFTEDNKDAMYARPLNKPTDKLYENSSIMVEDASYLRISDINFGYTFDSKMLEKIRLHSLRLYVSAHNPFIFTKYSGYNPEVSNSKNPLTPGIDYGTYPTSKSFVLGVNIKF